MARFGRNVLRVILVALVLGAVFAAFWLGMVPSSLFPFPQLSLDERPSWFVDARLAALRRDPAACRAVLREPHITAAPIPDNEIKNGCGWINAVRISSIGGAAYGTQQLTCEAAAALALWVEYEVQPQALAMFNSRVTSLIDMGTYDCRNIIGNQKWAMTRSQHALANAADIGGFRFADGRQISVAKDWKGSGPEAQFLRAVHAGACRYFRVAIGPDFNPAHWNHFHYDRGILRTCK